MRRAVPCVAALAVLFSCGLLLGQGQDKAPESNYDHLKEFGEAFVGEWTGEFAFDCDIPGVIKEGDKVIVRSSIKWILNKTALENNWEADINGKPAGSGKALIGWDRSARRIRSFGVGSFGGCGESTYEKVGDKWIEANVGAGIEGRRYAGSTITTFSDDGNTHVAEGIGRTSITGEVLPKLTITHKRVKAARKARDAKTRKVKDGREKKK